MRKVHHFSYKILDHAFDCGDRYVESMKRDGIDRDYRIYDANENIIPRPRRARMKVET